MGLLDNPVYNDIPPDLSYFAKDWLLEQPGTKMARLEGWQPRVADASYNYPLAYLTNMQPAVQWEDVGPAGARWHGYSKTPGGQWLKAPWHPTHWREEQAELQGLLNQLQY